ncbi:MAG: hypothetical protein Tsb002_07560 [Wenzhouxiangellaceae bacterium]
MLNMTQQLPSAALAARFPAASGTIRLPVASGDLVFKSDQLVGNKRCRLIPLVDFRDRWLAVLRLELTADGLRARTELLDAERKPYPGGWVEAPTGATVELSWDISEQGQCHYLAMNAY